MRTQQGDDAPLSYWWSLVRSDVRYYLWRRRNLAATVRSIWGTLAHRDNVQRCLDCGRRYPHWVASDELWERIVGGRHAVSGLCPGCLDRRAEGLGIGLLWVPQDVGDDFMADLNRTCDRIGAFR